MIVLKWGWLQDDVDYDRADCVDCNFRSGDARAILTPPMVLTTVREYKADKEESLGIDDVYIGLSSQYKLRDDSFVTDFTVCLGDSLQGLAAAVLIMRDPEALTVCMLQSVREFEIY